MAVRWRVAGGEDDEQGVSEHRRQRPRPTGLPAAHLVVVEAGQVLAALEAFLHCPPPPGDRARLDQSPRCGAVAGVVDQFPSLERRISSHQRARAGPGGAGSLLLRDGQLEPAPS